VRLLKRMLRERSHATRGRADRAGPARPGENPHEVHVDPGSVEVASVDGFQGREKDIIVFTAVRANTSGQVGFLADWRRVNVMLTRAKYGVIVIGNSATLRCEAQTWAHWLRWAETNGCITRITSSHFGKYDRNAVQAMGKRRMRATLRGNVHPGDRVRRETTAAVPGNTRSITGREKREATGAIRRIGGSKSSVVADGGFSSDSEEEDAAPAAGRKAFGAGRTPFGGAAKPAAAAAPAEDEWSD
tara:strand:- start:24 stop:758 length:735 start_codon:yes stop_codon:yes gene_type:complete